MRQLCSIKSVLSIILAVMLLSQTMIYTVRAEPRTFDIDMVCCTEKYRVYGEDQPAEANGKCQITMDVDVPVGEDERPDEPLESDTSESPWYSGAYEGPASFGTGVASQVAGGAQGAWAALSAAKDYLIGWSPNVYNAHTKLYHAFLDEEIFGAAIGTISSYKDSQSFATYLSEHGGMCKPNKDDPLSNFRPDCVIEKALCSYEKYSRVLFYQAGQDVTEEVLNKNNVTSGDLQRMMASYGRRDQALYEESQHAYEAIDTAIAVYAQFFQTYRLHLAFKQIITDLVKVRNMTAYLHDLVGCLPNKFVGVATTKCN